MNPKEFEDVIGRAATNAFESEPRPFLAERTLAHIAAEPQQRPARFWLWAFPVAAACLLVLTIPHSRSSKENPAITPSIPIHVETATPASVALPGSEKHQTAARRIASTHPLTEPAQPAYDVFPAPSAATPEEARLAALAARRLFMQPNDATVSIAEVDIQPIAPTHPPSQGDDDDKTNAHTDRD